MISREIIQMLYVRFANIWGSRFTSNHTSRIIEMWYEDWQDGLEGLDANSFREALKYCRENLEWSPSIAEFIRICDRSLNIPDPRQCMEAAIRGDLYHPIIKEISSKILSWDLRNESSEKLLRRFTELHNEEMISFRRKRSLSAQLPKEISNGSEVRGDNAGGTGVQKASGYLF